MLTELTIIQKIVAWSLPVIFAITLHEVAHGWIADKLGDPTPRALGRLSWNPIHHIDLLGTIILPLLLLAVSNFAFGWAKPIPIDERNLRHKKRDLALIALGGPSANFLMACAWAGITKIGLYCATINNDYLGDPLVAMGYCGIIINLILGVLNLLPLPPLDGSKVLYSVLPARWSYKLQQYETQTFWLLAILALSGVLNQIISPIVNFLTIVIEQLIT